MIKMKHLRERGEIATILTLGVLVVIGVSAMVSSLFLNQKKTTGSQAAVSCDDPKWKCGPECASQEVRNVYSQNSDKWRAEAGKIYGGCDKEDKPIPPTPSCPGKYDDNGSCNPACCNSDSQCSDGQKCNIPNGFCKSTTSCNPNKEAKFHETCVGGACVKQACPDTGTCVDNCSSCSGGGATTTGSGGSTTGTAPATDCTPGSGGKNAGKYYCCFAGGKGKRTDLKYPHYEEREGNVENCYGLDMTTGGTSNTPANTTEVCEEYNNINICNVECPAAHPNLSWSCDGTKCCPSGKAPNNVPTPTPACVKYDTTWDCTNKCESDYPGSTCPQGGLYCCSARANTTKITPSSSPTTVLSPTDKLWWEKINTPTPPPIQTDRDSNRDIYYLTPTPKPTDRGANKDRYYLSPSPAPSLAVSPTITSTPTVVQQAFCPNPNIPSIPEGSLKIRVYSSSGLKTYDPIRLANTYIHDLAPVALRGAKSLNEVRIAFVDVITSGILNAASTSLTEASREMSKSNPTTIGLSLFGEEVAFSVSGGFEMIALTARNINSFIQGGLTFKINAYVDTFINVVCR